MRASTIPILLLAPALILLAGGCGEWDRYWGSDSGPTGPTVEPDTTPPTVRLLFPAGPDPAQATPVAGAEYRVTVEAEDESGVMSVDLFLDGELLAGLPAPPWDHDWDTTGHEETSTHTLLATAVDSAGNVGTSAPAYARVFNSGPEIVIATPADSALVLGEITLRADLPGDHPEVVEVEFSAGFFSIGTATAAPWSLEIDSELLPAGWWPITAAAATVLGEVGVSPRVWIHVNNGSPTLSIDFPIPGHAVATRGTLVLEGTAIDGEEGMLPADRTVWSSDLDGELGAGSPLWISGLSVGFHTISWTGTNAWGTASTATLPIEVKAEGTYTFCEDIFYAVFEHHVCTKCHNPASSEFPAMEYDLTNHAGVMAGGLTTVFRAVYPCKPDSSFLYNKIGIGDPWTGDPMPPLEVFPPMTPASREMIRVWILEGAPPDDLTDCPPGG